MGLLRFRSVAPPAPPTRPAPAFLDVYEQTLNDACAVLRGYRVPAADLEDAAQEVFVVVARLLRNGVAPLKLRPWVVGIACRVGKCHRRRLLRDAAHHDHETDMASFAGPDVEAQREAETILMERERLAHRLVKGLANDDRKEVVMRFYLGGQNVKEIAADLGKPEGTVKKQLSTARDSMRKASRRREPGAAMVLPLFGVDALLQSLRHFKAPDELRARVWDRLKHLPTIGGGGGGGDGGSQVAPALPPAPPVAPTVAAASYGTAALLTAAALALLQGVVIGALWDPLRRSHGNVEARPETVAAAVTAARRTAPAPSAAPSARVAPSTRAAAVPPSDPSGSGIDAERVVLKRAEAALDARNVDIKTALAALTEHAWRWPGGGALASMSEGLRAQTERYMAEHPNDPQVVELRKHPKGTP